MGVHGTIERAVFLDRDGVINRAVVRNGRPYPPSRLDELELIPGVEDSLARLKSAGYLLVVVTNQPDVARGVQTRDVVEAFHSELARQLPIDEFRICFHDDRDACECRKPKPGMLLAAAAAHAISLEASVMVGDRWRDIEAGIRAGCRTVFIDYDYDEPRPATASAVCHSLAEAVDWIMSFEKDDSG